MSAPSKAPRVPPSANSMAVAVMHPATTPNGLDLWGLALATYLAKRVISDCMALGTDAAMCILNDLYGLTHILAISFEEAALKPASNEVLYRAINPRPLADGYRSIQSLVALAAFFAEAQS